MSITDGQVCDLVISRSLYGHLQGTVASQPLSRVIRQIQFVLHKLVPKLVRHLDMRVGYNIFQEIIAELLFDHSDDLPPELNLASERLKVKTWVTRCVGFLMSFLFVPTAVRDQKISEITAHCH